MAIMEGLQAISPGIAWQFVSYGTGGSTLVEFGHPVVDLGLPDENPFFETLIKSSDIIRRESPRIVLCHEEFAAVIAARAFGVPVVWLDDWFLDERDLRMQALKHVDSVIFMGEPGVFDEPSYLKGKIRYVGAVLREFRYHKQDRQRARQELGIDNGVTVVSVMPGAWATEERARIFDLLMPAFAALQRTRKLLCWIAGRDYAALCARTKEVPDVRMLEAHWPTEQLIVASDLVITKGNRGTIQEAAELGVPSISLSYGQNPIDEIIVSRIRSNLQLRVKGINVDYLTKCMDDTLGSWKGRDEPERGATAVVSVAQALADEIQKLGVRLL
jgi:hypothetical protein